MPQSGSNSQQTTEEVVAVQQVAPLTAEEKRLILQRLAELTACRQEAEKHRIAAAEYESSLQRLKAADELEREAWQNLLDNAQHATEIEKERAKVYLEQIEIYKKQVDILSKKKSVGCILKRIFTLGIARCR